MELENAEVEILAGKAVAGDELALDELLAEIRPRVLRHCQRMLPFTEDAEDACQEALLRVSQRIHGFAGRSLFTTWLFHVTANTCRDAYKRMKQQSEQTIDSLPERPDPLRTSVLVGSRLDLLDTLEKLEEQHPSWVMPFVLRDVYDLTYAEIAAYLDVPLGTAKRLIHDARGWIRREFQATRHRP